jgi:hypothetical protein
MSDNISQVQRDELLRLMGSKRARVVVEHIAEHGLITTEELEQIYGYNHPPRAARDVRDAGVPLITVRVTSKDGRSIAGYKFGDLGNLRKAHAGGRKNFSKGFKRALYETTKGRCGICSALFSERYLQIDHRVPYEIAGDDDDYEHHIAEYMLLCGSCNRAKSWSCEHCPNWDERMVTTCAACYWAYPDNYDHMALRQVKRIAVQWEQDELQDFARLEQEAARSRLGVADYIKQIVAKVLRPLTLFIGL